LSPPHTSVENIATCQLTIPTALIYLINLLIELLLLIYIFIYLTAAVQFIVLLLCILLLWLLPFVGGLLQLFIVLCLIAV